VGVLGVDKFHEVALGVQVGPAVRLVVASSVFLGGEQLFQRSDVFRTGSIIFILNLLKGELGVQQPWVNDLWCLKALAHHEYFCGSISGRLWLVGLYLGE